MTETPSWQTIIEGIDDVETLKEIAEFVNGRIEELSEDDTEEDETPPPPKKKRPFPVESENLDEMS